MKIITGTTPAMGYFKSLFHFPLLCFFRDLPLWNEPWPAWTRNRCWVKLSDMGRSLHLFLCSLCSVSQGDTGETTAVFHISRIMHKDCHVLGCSKYHTPGKELQGFSSFSQLIWGVRQCCLSSVLEQGGITRLGQRGKRQRKAVLGVSQDPKVCAWHGGAKASSMLCDAP